MKIGYPDIGNLENDDVEAIRQAIIVPAKQALGVLRNAVGGNLTIRDNQYAAIVTLGYQGNSTQTCTSGTEYTLQNPLKTKPIGFTPISAVNANGAAIPTGAARLNNSRTDGLTGITVELGFNTQPWLWVSKSSNQTLTTATSTNLTWDVINAGGQDPVPAVTPLISNGTIYVASSDSTRIMITEAGRYLFTAVVTYAANATGTRFATFMKTGDNSSVTSQPGQFFLPSAGASRRTAITVPAIIDMTISDYVQVVGFQDSGANLDVLGNQSAGTLLQISRVWSKNTGIVTGILWGG